MLSGEDIRSLRLEMGWTRKQLASRFDFYLEEVRAVELAESGASDYVAARLSQELSAAVRHKRAQASQ